jgi:hypothetical protein
MTSMSTSASRATKMSLGGEWFGTFKYGLRVLLLLVIGSGILASTGHLPGYLIAMPLLTLIVLIAGFGWIFLSKARGMNL